MVDEQKRTTDDEEYQFPEDEYVASDNTETNHFASNEEGGEDTKASGGNPLVAFFEKLQTIFEGRNKRIFFVAIALVIVIVVIKVVSSRNSQEKLVKQTPTTQQTQAVQQPLVQTKPQVQQQPSISEPSSTNMDETRAYQSQTEEKISTLDTKLSNVEDSLVQSEASSAQLQQSVNALTQQVQMLSKQLKEAEAMQQHAPKQKRVVFYLRAVVPDRAWVMTPSGETVSVSVGDSLDQYGRILSIDPVYGVIRTSSGRKITYGANDY